MLTGSFRNRGRICWYVVDGIKQKMEASTVCGRGLFLCTGPHMEVCRPGGMRAWQREREVYP